MRITNNCRHELHRDRIRSSISADGIHRHTDHSRNDRHVRNFRQSVRRRRVAVVFTIDVDRMRRNVFRYVRLFFFFFF